MRLSVGLAALAACAPAAPATRAPGPGSPPATVVAPPAASGAAPAASVGPPAWPVPASWRAERIPFPLDFAPSLPHRGVEDIRFAPGFMKPGAPDFWSYVFAWRLEDATPLDAPALSAELTTYFRGLVTAVDGETHKVVALDASRIVARLEGAPGAMTGVAESVDPFKTGEPLHLRVRARWQRCAAGGQAVVVSVSPAPDGPTWDALAPVAASFSC